MAGARRSRNTTRIDTGSATPKPNDQRIAHAAPRPGRGYTSSPLVEAVAEFRYDLGAPWDLAIPGLMYERLRGEFPVRRPVKEFEATVMAGAQGMQQQYAETERLQILRQDEKALVQVSPTVLAVNRLKPYTGWENFRPLIALALNAFHEVAKPKVLRQVGLRYLNHISFHGPVVALKEFLDFYPYVGDSLPQNNTSMIAGVQIPYEEHKHKLLLTLTGPWPINEVDFYVLLDLNYLIQTPNEQSVRNTLDLLETAHRRIEDVFEGCLTDSLRARFREPQS
jgi:uncharacterized protein (TIGR04255 family)